MRRSCLEALDVGKCERLLNKAVLLIENRSKVNVSESEIINLDYHEALTIEETLKKLEQTVKRYQGYSCEWIPVIDGNSTGDTYKLIIRRQK